MLLTFGPLTANGSTAPQQIPVSGHWDLKPTNVSLFGPLVGASVTVEHSPSADGTFRPLLAAAGMTSAGTVTLFLAPGDWVRVTVADHTTDEIFVEVQQ